MTDWDEIREKSNEAYRAAREERAAREATETGTEDLDLAQARQWAREAIAEIRRRMRGDTDGSKT